MLGARAPQSLLLTLLLHNRGVRAQGSVDGGELLFGDGLSAQELRM
jgi:hypothetical protein